MLGGMKDKIKSLVRDVYADEYIEVFGSNSNGWTLRFTSEVHLKCLLDLQAITGMDNISVEHEPDYDGCSGLNVVILP